MRYWGAKNVLPPTRTMHLSAPALEHVADLRVTVASPIEAGHVLAHGREGLRRIIPISGGTVAGPHFSGRILPGGADFQLVVSATVAELDARYLLALDGPGDLAGQHIYVQNCALRRGSAENMTRLVSGLPVDPAAVYFRSVLTLEVSCEALRWLTESVFIGTGARYPDHVLVSMFRVA